MHAALTLRARVCSQQNLTENATSIEAFNDVCGSVINIAVWSRSLVSKGEFTYVKLPDGTRNGVYETTRFGLILASMAYVVKYTFRGMLDIPFEELPVGGDAKLLARANELTTSTDGRATVSPFTALLMMIGEYIHNLEVRGEIQPSELVTLFKQIDALTQAEGKIASSVSFSYPRVLRVLLYSVFCAWLGLLSLTQIAPESGWHSLWLSGLLSLSSIGLYSMSNRYAVRTPHDPLGPALSRSRSSTRVCPCVCVRAEPLHDPLDQVHASPVDFDRRAPNGNCIGRHFCLPWASGHQHVRNRAGPHQHPHGPLPAGHADDRPPRLTLIPRSRLRRLFQSVPTNFFLHAHGVHYPCSCARGGGSNPDNLYLQLVCVPMGTRTRRSCTPPTAEFGTRACAPHVEHDGLQEAQRLHTLQLL